MHYKNLIIRRKKEREYKRKAMKPVKNILQFLPATVWILRYQLDYLSLWVNLRGFQSVKFHAKVKILTLTFDFNFNQTFLCNTLIFLSLISKWSRSSFISDETRFFSCVALRKMSVFALKLSKKALLNRKKGFYHFNLSYLKSLLSFLLDQFVLLF